MKHSLSIHHLTVEVAGKTVLNDFSLEIPKGEVHAIMGPNGAGKSSLAKAIAGHEDYTIISGQILVDGVNIVGLEPDAISKAGVFMAFQYPSEIPGVTIANFIRAALQARLEKDQAFVATDYYKELYSKMDLLKMDRNFTSRPINVGFSGGEKKRCEILQMLMLQPTYSIMDETDSGLDIDALKIVAEGVNLQRSPNTASLIITHYQRLLNYIVPDKVHVMHEGRIIKTGGKELALELEDKGYDWLKNTPSLSIA